MINCTALFTDEQDKISINEEKTLDFISKSFSYLAERPDIIKLSALKEYNLQDYTINLELLICDDLKIKEINREYRQKDKPTDVLSFALFADTEEQNRIVFDNNIFLGEIIISVETTQRQAVENNKSFEDEFYFLLGHGILHLLGFDHHDEQSLDFMIKLQSELVSNGT